MTQAEVKLAARARKGDDDAFLKLFQQYQEQLYKTAFIYVNNEADALDVIQETAYRSYKSIGGLRSPEFFKTWLVKICISCAIDLIRKSSKVIPIDSQEVCDRPVPVSEQSAFMELLTGLNEEQKGLVILKYYYGYTFEDIGEMLKIPVGTAKTNLYKALNKLKLQMNHDCLREGL